MSRTISSLCVAGLASFALLTPTAAHAAPDGARGEANAVTLSILGESGDSGTVLATNDGTGEEKTGEEQPALTVLGGQDLIGAGILIQDAVARDNATSAACAGVTGDEGAVANIGEADRCISEEDNVSLDLDEVDLAALLDIELVTGTGTLGDLLGTLGEELEGQVLTELQAGLDAFTAAGLTGALGLELGALESACTYDNGQADGTTYLTDIGLNLTIGETTVPVIDEDYDPGPDPNTKPLSEFGAVVDLLVDELEASLSDELDDIALLTDPVQAQILAEITPQLEEQVLAQIEENLIDITLNKQTRQGSSIQVTGLEAIVLPTAEEGGAPAPLVELQLANVGCGPFAGAAPGGPTDSEGNPVPTVVNAGEGSTPWMQGGLLGGLALLVAGGTVVGLRRARS